MLKWHKVQFVPGKEDADTISLTLIGKDKGIAPMPRVPAALKVELPNDYSIVISDPEHSRPFALRSGQRTASRSSSIFIRPAIAASVARCSMNPASHEFTPPWLMGHSLGESHTDKQALSTEH